jgi:hypothetical protein
MIKYPHVEDYLELLAGYEPNASNLFNTSQYTFSLARYDVSIVENMANSTLWNSSALTDKQGELAVKLILKYRRQYANHGIDITPVETPVWRIPLRKVDRTQSVWSDGENLYVKFPFDQQKIEEMRQLKDTGQGRAEWDRETKIWKLGITEYNVNFIVSWANTNQIEIDPKIVELFHQILHCESQPYEIKLIRTKLGYEVTNAADSLKEYVANHIGDDFIKLIDYSGILGYTVSADLLEEASIKYGQALEYIGTKRNIHLEPRQELVEWIFNYAELTNRYPICIYDPSPLPFNQSLVDLDRFDEKDIVRFDLNGKTNTSDYDPYNVKIIYAKKIPKTWEFPIPLLVSTQQMMFGGKKLDWINRAEKIIYFCNTKLKEEN